MIHAVVAKSLIVKTVLATSLLVPVAVDRSVTWPLPEQGMAMPSTQAEAAVAPLVSSATECIARTVSADPHFAVTKGPADFNDLIVASVPSCADDLRAMIDAYDHFYGAGAGESFFTGPYLDGLPAAVTTRVKSTR
jgi:hypothetical protein